MQDLELCRLLLGLDEPWQVEAMHVDRPSNRIDLVVGWSRPPRKGLFKGQDRRRCADCGQSLPASDALRRIALRHLPFGGCRVYLQVPAPGSVACSRGRCPLGQTWAAPGARLTHELEARVMEALEVCGSIQGAARALALSPAEVRAVAERTGAGLAPDRPEAAPAAHAQTQVIDIVDAGLVPAAGDPVWNELLEGRLQLVDDRVGLKLLLERVRRAIAQGTARRADAVRVLRNYFIRNQAQHREDLALLSGGRPAAGGPLPVLGDPCWQAIIDGALNLETRHVALNMMIERVRLSVRRDPGTRDAGARILRQFFAKHGGKLRPELAQLSGRSAGGAPLLPAESHSCWQRLIDGELALAADSVGLKMMLERIRLSVARNPTPANRKAGARILRQYFMKHRRRLSRDIKQLAAQAAGDETLAA